MLMMKSSDNKTEDTKDVYTISVIKKKNRL